MIITPAASCAQEEKTVALPIEEPRNKRNQGSIELTVVDISEFVMKVAEMFSN